MQNYAPKMLAGDFTPQGAIAVSYKDSGLMWEQGKRAGQQYTDPPVA